MQGQLGRQIGGPAMSSNNIQGDLATLNLVGVFRDLGLECRGRTPGKFHVDCPWMHEHGETGKTDTVIWQEDGKWPEFHCSHNHCSQRKLNPDVIEWAESTSPGIIDAHCAQSFETCDIRVKQDFSATAKSKVKPFTPTGEIIPLPTGLEHVTPPEFLGRLFRPDELIFITRDYKRSDEGHVYTLQEWQEIHEAKPHRFRTELGIWFCINPLIYRDVADLDAAKPKKDGKGNLLSRSSARCDDNVENFRYCLLELEIDKKERPRLTPAECVARMQQFYGCLVRSGLPLATIYTSGADIVADGQKSCCSLHALVKIGAKDAAEFEERTAKVFEYCALMPGLDKRDDESRLSRLPGAYRGESKQTLLRWEVGAAEFEDWNPEMIQPEPVVRPESHRHKPQPMRREAYYGLAGEVVETALPNTEASPEALLVQFLIAFGNMIGRDIYRNQGSYHHTNNYVCIVGESSDAKGVSWEVVRELLKEIDHEWLKNCVKQGLATGEALINEIRDERAVIVRGKKDKITGEAETVVEPGIEDKRALVLEQEFSRLLSVSSRQGNPMSEVLRLAFDSPPFLSALSKTSPLSASKPHVSVIGHITPAELSRAMKSVDRSNGFANRFLWVQTYWRHDLPFAEVPAWSEKAELVSNLKNAVAWAKEKPRYMKWTKEGSAAWAKWYKTRRKHTGEVGIILNRDRVHILRLAMIYAILDCREEMTETHFDAAKAVWDYAEQSARRIFGNATGNRKADLSQLETAEIWKNDANGDL
jgi:hypothetical protein